MNINTTSSEIKGLYKHSDSSKFYDIYADFSGFFLRNRSNDYKEENILGQIKITNISANKSIYINSYQKKLLTKEFSNQTNRISEDDLLIITGKFNTILNDILYV